MQHPTTGGIPMPVPINRPRLGRGAPLTAERELYLRPVTQGMSNIEACRKVGIHRITGVRWRDGRTMVDSGTDPPLRTDYHPSELDFRRFLSEEERVRIGDLRQAGHSIRAVAADLGRSPSTSCPWSTSQQPVTGCRVDGRHSRAEAELTNQRSVHPSRPRIVQGFR